MPTIPLLQINTELALPEVPALDHLERPRINVRGVLAGMKELGEASQRQPVDAEPFVAASGAMGHAVGGALIKAGDLFAALAERRQEAAAKERLHKQQAVVRDTAQSQGVQARTAADTTQYLAGTEKTWTAVRKENTAPDRLPPELRHALDTQLGADVNQARLAASLLAINRQVELADNAMVTNRESAFAAHHDHEALRIEMDREKYKTAQPGDMESLVERLNKRRRDDFLQADPREYGRLLARGPEERPEFMQSLPAVEAGVEQARVEAAVARKRADAVEQVSADIQSGALVSSRDLALRLGHGQYDPTGELSHEDVAALMRKFQGPVINDPAAFVKLCATVAKFDHGTEGDLGAARLKSEVGLSFTDDYEDHLLSKIDRQVKATRGVGTMDPMQQAKAGIFQDIASKLGDGYFGQWTINAAALHKDARTGQLMRPALEGERGDQAIKLSEGDAAAYEKEQKNGGDALSRLMVTDQNLKFSAGRRAMGIMQALDRGAETSKYRTPSEMVRDYAAAALPTGARVNSAEKLSGTNHNQSAQPQSGAMPLLARRQAAWEEMTAFRHSDFLKKRAEEKVAAANAIVTGPHGPGSQQAYNAAYEEAEKAKADLGRGVSDEMRQRSAEVGAKYGLSPEQSIDLFDDVGKATEGWEAKGFLSGGFSLTEGFRRVDQTRTLSDGRMVVNPNLWIDPAAYEKAVRESNATEDQKEAALDEFPELHRQTALRLYQILSPIPAYREFMEKQPGDVVAKVDALREEQNRNPAWSYLQTKFAEGLNSLSASAAGILASATALEDRAIKKLGGDGLGGSVDTTGKWAKDAEARVQALNTGADLSKVDQFTKLAGGAVEFIPDAAAMYATGGVAEGVQLSVSAARAARMAGTIVEDLNAATTALRAGTLTKDSAAIADAMTAAARARGVSGAGLEKIIADTAQLPPLARLKAIEEAAVAKPLPGQVAKAAANEANRNLGAMYFAAKGYGSAYMEAVSAYEKAGVKPEEARMKAMLPALITAASTYAIFSGGSERSLTAMFQSEPAARAMLDYTFKQAVRNIVGHGAVGASQMALDSLAHDMVAVASYDRKLTPDEIFERAWTSAKTGALFGGFMRAFHEGVSRRVDESASNEPAPAGSHAVPDFSTIGDEVVAELALKTEERAKGTLKEQPQDLHPAWSLRKRLNQPNTENAKLESEQAKVDASRANLDRGELFKDVADIWKHAPGRVRRLIEEETRKYDGSSQESFRTTVSKKILEELRKDRTLFSGFKWRKYLESHIGPVPLVDGKSMYDPHTHHFIYQKWLETQDPLVREAHELLWGVGIDPLFGLENLGWAPKAITGQHTTANLQNMVGQLRKLKEDEFGYNEFVRTLNDFGRAAAARKRTPPTHQNEQ